ncbi:hypothetical protein CR513_09219, partial [Mucuna pruriens]
MDKNVWEHRIIDERWDNQLHRSLHVLQKDGEKFGRNKCDGQLEDFKSKTKLCKKAQRSARDFKIEDISFDDDWIVEKDNKDSSV